MARIRSDLFEYESKYEIDGVLSNKLNITDPSQLEKIERMITSKKLSELYLSPGKQTFDVEHYCRIHKYIFGDIYPFAGNIRDESIQKVIPFCPPIYIRMNLKKTLDDANRKVPYLDSKDKLLRYVCELHSELDVIHPFREGNGRSNREYIRQYMEMVCKRNGLDNYYLDYGKIEDKDEYIDAMIKADAFLDYSKIYMIFNSILSVKEKEIIKKK